MKYIKLFEEHQDSVKDLLTQRDEISALGDLGLFDEPSYKAATREIDQQVGSILRKTLRSSKHRLYSKEWFDELRGKPELDWLIEIVDSPEYADLLAKGMFLSSSVVQLVNKTLVFSKNPDRDPKKDHAIGIFGSIHVVRRIVPKTGGRDMDMIMKKFSGLSDSDFFKTAMKWVVDNVDFSLPYFPTIKTAKSAAKTKTEAAILLELVNRLVQESSANISAATSSKTALILFQSFNRDAASRRRTIKELTKYFETGSAILSFNMYQYYNQDMITVLSKPGITLKVEGGDNYQYLFEGQITNLDDLNMLPINPFAWSIGLRPEEISQESAFNSMELILAKLSSLGLTSAQYISIYLSHPNRDAERVANDRIKELSSKYGIEYLAADTRYAIRE